MTRRWRRARAGSALPKFSILLGHALRLVAYEMAVQWVKPESPATERQSAEGSSRSRLGCATPTLAITRAALHAPTSAAIIPKALGECKRWRSSHHYWSGIGPRHHPLLPTVRETAWHHRSRRALCDTTGPRLSARRPH